MGLLRAILFTPLDFWCPREARLVLTLAMALLLLCSMLVPTVGGGGLRANLLGALLELVLAHRVFRRGREHQLGPGPVERGSGDFAASIGALFLLHAVLRAVWVGSRLLAETPAT